MVEKYKIISNSLSMIANRLAQSITAFVLTAAIARTLGAEALGQYLLAYSYYFIFVGIASQGLKTLFTRELAREPERTPVYLMSGTWLQLIFSFFSYGALVLVVFLLPYSSKTSTICYIMGLTIIPFALSNVTESIFQAQEKMHLIAIATIPVYILRIIVMIWAMQLKYGIEYLGVILCFSETLILVIEWILIARLVKIQWEIDGNFVFHTIKSARTFFAIEAIAVVNSRIQILILSLLGNEFLVGLFGGIAQLLQPFLIIANSITLAIFPRLSKAVTQGREQQKQITEGMIEVLLMMGLPLFIGLLFFGKDLLIFVYDASFSQANLALSLSAASLVVLPFIRPLSYLLVANGFEIVNLREVVITTTLGSLIGIVLVSEYKLMGAALMALLMTIIGCSQYVYFSYFHLFSLNLWRIMRRPLIISFLMLTIFIVLQKIRLNFMFTLLIASTAYCLFAVYLGIRAFGGFRFLWMKFLKES
ncbi:MAG: oligosaccharide flippase family protein [Nostoc sp. DedVER02]|uniref:oligosaccharide flippase family protein n=1 Tax=unclassified Nostoc TaxID=2593658 RepID=UPI002AD34F20|nr:MULTISPECIES: oligosaccharide flippase family protein [unclassified Nostoc]MDZ7985144.1 oligosaccharide flippase family protein [Nostoc sp. DedVER02]MDZ8113266.1 oligosaccharide flippase family protein [Nostoc sp. DedVER01b]